MFSKRTFSRNLGRVSIVAAVGLVGTLFAAALAVPPTPLNTTINDFYLKGTQPTPPFINEEANPAMTELLSPQNCAACHGFYDQQTEPYTRWQHSMMGQSFRDPVFRAVMSIAQQDSAFVGDTCLRCHAPAGWIQARNVPTDGSALTIEDQEGVTCHACHRMVDPDFKPGISPGPDIFILDGLGADAPNGLHSNGYVIDSKDRRRGPFDLGPDFHIHRFLESPLHRSSDMCASCHDVSNPAFTRQPDGNYTLNALDTHHDTTNKEDMFPEQRTYSEWLHSAFAAGPVELGENRYGGQIVNAQGMVEPQTAYSSCQDCHMPKVTGYGCEPFLLPPLRNNLPQHNFNGANSWVLRAVKNLYPDGESHLFYPEEIDNSINRNIAMLQAAADVTATAAGTTVSVRVTNQTGHKLPTGYPEGRRAWLNVKFFDSANTIIGEAGEYDTVTATLNGATTKVYQAKHGLGPDIAATTGLPAGPSFHLALNNKVYFDNRIPPRGWTFAAYESVGAAPVAATYADGQYWDETQFTAPPGTTRAEVRMFHQTSSKEYMEFIRDEDITIPFDRPVPWGTLVYDQWVILGKSAPVEMAFVEVPFSSCTADFNGDGNLDPDDLADYISCYFSQPPCASADFDQSGNIDPDDLADYISAFFAGCQ